MIPFCPLIPQAIPGTTYQPSLWSTTMTTTTTTLKQQQQQQQQQGY